MPAPAPSFPVHAVLVSYLHLPAAELVALLQAATWLRRHGRLIYVGHARSNRTHGVGGPSEPGVLPEIAELARAAHGMRTVALQHLVLPTARSASPSN